MAAGKGKVSPDIFLRGLKEDTIPPVVVIVGEEAFYRDKVRQKVLDLIFGDTPKESRDITQFESQTDLQKLSTLVNTYPFFGGRSVAYITDKELLTPKGNDGNNIQQKREDLLKILADVPDFATVILQTEKMDGRQKFTKTMQKEFTFVDCSPVKARYLPNWLQEQAAARGGRFTTGAVRRIEEMLETVDDVPLQLLVEEVEKISLYAGERREWTEEDVDKLFSAVPEIGIFALNDAIAGGNLVRALSLVAEEKRKKTYLPLMVAKIAGGLRNMLAVQEGVRQRKNDAAIAAAMGKGKSTYMVSRLKRQGAKFSEAKLSWALVNMDRLAQDISLGGRGYERLEEILVVLMSR